jgi:hypothetical protein
MILKDVLEDCLVKLGYSDSIDLSGDLTEANQKIADKLVRCANMVYAEICTSYIPLICKENATFEDGQVLISSLANRLLYVIGVRFKGVSKRFRLYSSYIESTESGEAEVEYAMLPEAFTLNSTVPETCLPSWLFAEGICSEFCYAENLADMSVAFDNKFREGINRLKTKSVSRFVKARGWY